METAAFYSCLNIMNKQGVAILLVSDNSTNNKSLVEKSIEDENKYNYVRNNDIARIISLIIDYNQFIFLLNNYVDMFGFLNSVSGTDSDYTVESVVTLHRRDK